MLGETDGVEVKCGLVVFQWRMPSFFVGGSVGQLRELRVVLLTGHQPLRRKKVSG
jgi:hypothetical protein